ncbi:MAG: M48 family metallopeptidase [Planctomycetota bacterium]
MDFFEHQDRAKRNSGRLVLLFGLAVLGTILAVYASAVLVFGGVAAYSSSNSGKLPTGTSIPSVGSDGGFDPWNPGLFALVAVGTGAVIGVSSLVKTAQLRSGGGASVAAMLGGKLVARDSADPNERTLLNVVDEMAIASGTPAPPVYLMQNEAGINAFAAGYAPDRAVIGVTRGAVERLSRDELQGVVAHEFSHILHGDMRINIRLIGLIHGIVALSVIGWVVVRSMLYAPRRRRSSSGKNEGAGKLAFVAFGVMLIVIGAVGRVFGMLIQAAISRQREFLADAAAVQYTRNPTGIAGALATIGGLKAGSRIEDPQAAEVRHMLFANGVASSLSRALASHPPLKERIRRIDAQLAQQVGASLPQGASSSDAGASGLAMGFAGGSAPDAHAAPVHSAVQSIGEVDPAHVAYARELLAKAPASLRKEADSSFGARAVVYALLLDRDDAQVRAAQWQALGQHAETPVLTLTRKLEAEALALPIEARLPVLDLTWPSLEAMSARQTEAFLASIDGLIRADQRLELFEWALRRLVRRRLTGERTAVRGRGAPLASAGDALQAVSAALSWVGAKGDAEAAQRAFASAMDEAGMGQDTPLPESPSAETLGRSLDALERVNPTGRRTALRALAKAVSHDGRVTPSEGELLRVAAESLGAPMSPLLPGQPVV